jgi:hypothetical protein
MEKSFLSVAPEPPPVGGEQQMLQQMYGHALRLSTQKNKKSERTLLTSFTGQFQPP